MAKRSTTRGRRGTGRSKPSARPTADARSGAGSEAYAISAPPGLDVGRVDAERLYHFMVLNRRLERRLGNLYRQNQVVGGLYSSLGQEATSVGTAYALGDGDFLAPMIRNLGSLLVRGVEPRDVIAQYCARATSPTGGRDANLHFGSIAMGLIAPISVVGALIPVMAGVALEIKARAKKTVALTYIGDGGSSTGYFHEGLNLASVHRLPMILVVENNGYAYSTPVARQTGVTRLAQRAVAYGIHGETVDGNNVLAVLDCTRRARRRCLEGGGPVLIEAVTFRRKGHAEHDDAGYVPAELLEYWERRDPIDAFRSWLVGTTAGPARIDTTRIDRIGAEIDELLEDSVQAALNATYPGAVIGEEDVYA